MDKWGFAYDFFIFRLYLMTSNVSDIEKNLVVIEALFIGVGADMPIIFCFHSNSLRHCADCQGAAVHR
jgi:hypothetical protein